MKTKPILTLLLLSLHTAVPGLRAQSAGDYLFYRKAGAGFDGIYLTPANNQVIGFNGSGVLSLSAPFSGAFADLTGKPTTLTGYGITDAQPLDADLTALAALNGTNTIYYRSAANTWSPVTIGTGLTFTTGTLAATLAAGGASGEVQYNNGGTLAGLSGMTTNGGVLKTLTVTPANDTTGLTISGGSITAAGSTAFARITGLWNTTGTPDALVIDITNTASANGSRWISFQNSGTEIAGIGKDAVHGDPRSLVGFTVITTGDSNGTIYIGATQIFGLDMAVTQTGIKLKNADKFAISADNTSYGADGLTIQHNGSNMIITDVVAGPIWRTGSGSPEGLVTAPIGSLYTRTDGGSSTTLYVKESGGGNTGWIAK